MNTIYYILLSLFIVLSLFLILLVLIQKGRGGGLASAFGGVGGNTAFGAKTGDVLTWATSIVFGVFMVLGICLNLLANSIHEETVRQQTDVNYGVTKDAPKTEPNVVNPPTDGPVEATTPTSQPTTAPASQPL